MEGDFFGGDYILGFFLILGEGGTARRALCNRRGGAGRGGLFRIFNYFFLNSHRDRSMPIHRDRRGLGEEADREINPGV